MFIGLGTYVFRYSLGLSSLVPKPSMGAFEFLERAARYGAEVVQFADNLPLDQLNDVELYALKALAAKLGLIVEVGTAGAEAKRLRRYLGIAKIFDAKLVRLALHSDFEELRPSYEESLRAIQEVMPEYESAQVKLAIENYFHIRSVDLARLINTVGSPFLGVCLDTANSIRQQEWPLETMRILAPFTFNLHLKDYQLQTHPDRLGVMITGARLGEGDLDIITVLKHLKSLAREFTIILEQWLPMAGSVEETLQLENDWVQSGLKSARKKLESVYQQV